MQTVRSFVGMDVHKETISISVAEDGRNGPVRFLGVIPNAADDVAKMAKRLSKHGELDFCYEASGCGYGIHRQLTALGHKCIVVAPSMIPRKPGERIKTDRRDSEKLAILHRSGDLTPVWVPDTTHEALRDLVRARVDASMHPRHRLEGTDQAVYSVSLHGRQRQEAHRCPRQREAGELQWCGGWCAVRSSSFASRGRMWPQSEHGG
jgi:transposase